MKSSEHQGNFLNQQDLARTFANLGYPIKEAQLKIVGIDIIPSRILRLSGEPLQLDAGSWRIPPNELMRVEFDIAFLPLLSEIGLTPKIHWRSSNHRCGAGGGDFYLWDGKLYGNYQVYNPFGLVVDQQTAVAQLSLTVANELPDISEPLKVSQVERFESAGRISPTKTYLPRKSILQPSGLGWELERGVPHLVTFQGIVKLANNEVLVPSRHLSDFLRFGVVRELSGYSCLGDPGYEGVLGMLIIAYGNSDEPPILLSKQQTLATRIARHRVIVDPKLTNTLPSYATIGQYQGETVGDTNYIEFRKWTAWPELQSVVGPASLKELLEK